MANASRYREISYISRDGGVTSLADTELHFRDGTVCRVVRSKCLPDRAIEVCAAGDAVDYERRLLAAKFEMSRIDAAEGVRRGVLEETG